MKFDDFELNQQQAQFLCAVCGEDVSLVFDDYVYVGTGMRHLACAAPEVQQPRPSYADSNKYRRR